MATVLVSFIGTGEYKGTDYYGVSKTGYKEVTYNFENGSKVTTTVFGSALLQYLKNKGQQVDSWLIMGTRQSIWCDLVEMFGHESDDIIANNFEVWEILYEQAKNDALNNSYESSISQEHLSAWQKVLTNNLTDTKVICKLDSDATDMSSRSHDLIFQSLLEVIKDGDKVVFDVTHGLRHQPLITSFVLMYLRYLRNIKIENIEFYYGAKDLDGKVARLDFCNELLKAIEAVAIFEQTGNYEQIGKNLKLSVQFNKSLETLTFFDEINKTNARIPFELQNEISNTSFSPLKESLADRFRRSLHWAGKESLANQLRHKALFAFDRRQYFKAILILSEAIVVAYGENCGDNEVADNLELHHYREIAGEELKRFLNENEKQTYLNLKTLRNAIAHGTDTNGTKVEANKTREAMNNEERLKEIFRDGDKLFVKITKGEIGNEPD
jgi:cell division protein DivIC